MQDIHAPRVAKWPFFVSSPILLALAWYTFHQAKRPMGSWEVIACVVCVGLACLLSIWPYILEYRTASKLVETGALTSVVSQVQNLQEVANRIAHATSQWQGVQESADKTARQAKDIAGNMASETKAFTEFLQQANDNEKATLRLEVEKLRRAEAEWLQTVVRILDHVFALNRAAAQSRQPNVIEQLRRFQAACHDAARRVGLMPFSPDPEEKFDGHRHQPVGPLPGSADTAIVEETVANGYTYQGKLIRPATVRLRSSIENGEQPLAPEPNTQTTSQPVENELPLA